MCERLLIFTPTERGMVNKLTNLPVVEIPTKGRQGGGLSRLREWLGGRGSLHNEGCQRRRNVSYATQSWGRLE